MGCEQDRCGYEAEPRTSAFLEVVRDKGTVDAGADRTREDDDVGAELGERHVTITVPSMSLLCSVHT